MLRRGMRSFQAQLWRFLPRLKQARDALEGAHPEPMMLTAIDLRQYPDYPAVLKALRRYLGNFADALKPGDLGVVRGTN